MREKQPSASAWSLTSAWSPTPSREARRPEDESDRPDRSSPGARDRANSQAATTRIPNVAKTVPKTASWRILICISLIAGTTRLATTEDGDGEKSIRSHRKPRQVGIPSILVAARRARPPRRQRATACQRRCLARPDLAVPAPVRTLSPASCERSRAGRAAESGARGPGGGRPRQPPRRAGARGGSTCGTRRPDQPLLRSPDAVVASAQISVRKAPALERNQTPDRSRGRLPHCRRGGTRRDCRSPLDPEAEVNSPNALGVTRAGREAIAGVFLLVASLETLPADRASLSGCRNLENGVVGPGAPRQRVRFVSAASIALRGLGARG